MTTRKTSTPLATIALAIAVVLSAAGDASACTTAGKAPAQPRGCCASRPQKKACGCCGTSKPAASKAVAAPDPDPDHASLSADAPAPSCGCREGSPAAPTERSQARPPVPTQEARFDATTYRVARHSTAKEWLAAALDRDPGPPRLYLRTSRLLI